MVGAGGSWQFVLVILEQIQRAQPALSRALPASPPSQGQSPSVCALCFSQNLPKACCV